MSLSLRFYFQNTYNDYSEFQFEWHLSYIDMTLKYVAYSFGIGKQTYLNRVYYKSYIIEQVITNIEKNTKEKTWRWWKYFSIAQQLA